MKGIVIYQSKYGATMQYAQWIGSELGLPVKEAGELSSQALKEYDTVIIGSSVYFGKLLIRKWLNQRWKAIHGKKFFLFVVSGTPPEKQVQLHSYLESSMPAEARDKCEVFFLPGKLEIHNLSMMDRFMLKAGATLSRDELTKKQMLTDYNSVAKENILPIVKAVKSTILKPEMVQVS
jgi:menaquinone-dependent protoporphyrinogen IX oxidase